MRRGRGLAHICMYMRRGRALPHFASRLGFLCSKIVAEIPDVMLRLREMVARSMCRVLPEEAVGRHPLYISNLCGAVLCVCACEFFLAPGLHLKIVGHTKIQL